MKAKALKLDLAIRTIFELEKTLNDTPKSLVDKENLICFIKKLEAINEVNKYYFQVLAKFLCAQAFKNNEHEVNDIFIDARFRVKNIVRLFEEPTAFYQGEEVKGLPLIYKWMALVEGKGGLSEKKFEDSLIFRFEANEKSSRSPRSVVRKKLHAIFVDWRKKRTTDQCWQDIFQAALDLRRRLHEDVVCIKSAINQTIFKNWGEERIVN